MRGLLSKLKAKIAGLFRFLFATRQRAFWSVTGLIVLVVGLGIGIKLLNNRLDFLAFDGPPSTTTEAYDGIEYIGHVTSDMFRQSLFELPEAQISEDDKIALITNLSGVGYFVQPTAEKRAARLAAADIPQELKALVGQIESSSGSQAWLSDLNKQACGAGQVSRNTFGIEAAQADDGDWCVGETLAHIHNLQKQVADPVVVEFANAWYWLASTSTIGCEVTGVGAIRKRILQKRCWSSDGLNHLYREYWPDLKTRLRGGFTNAEAERITRNNELYDLTLRPVEQWGQEMIAARLRTLDLVLWAIPLGKIVSIPLKVSGKALEKLFATRPLRAYALATVLWTTRTGDLFHTIGSGSLAGTPVNISREFFQSSLFTGAKGYVVKFGRDWTDARRIIAAEGANALDDLLTTSFTKDRINLPLARTLMAKTEIARTQVFYNLKYSGSKDTYCDSAACATWNTQRTLINEEQVYRKLIINLGDERLARVEARKIHVHEYLHHLQKGTQSYWYYSPVDEYRPLMEGYTEWFTLRVAREKGYYNYLTRTHYSQEVSVADYIHTKLSRLLDGWNGNNSALAQAKGMKIMREIYFEQGPRLIDLYLEPNILRGSPLAKETINVGKKLTKWIDEEMDRGDYYKVRNYINEYIMSEKP